MKTTHLAKGKGGYLNIQAENTTDFSSISTDDMDRQSVKIESPVNLPVGPVLRV
jgi:hypothetical protein